MQPVEHIQSSNKLDASLTVLAVTMIAACRTHQTEARTSLPGPHIDIVDMIHQLATSYIHSNISFCKGIVSLGYAYVGRHLFKELLSIVAPELVEFPRPDAIRR